MKTIENINKYLSEEKKSKKDMMPIKLLLKKAEKDLMKASRLSEQLDRKYGDIAGEFDAASRNMDDAVDRISEAIEHLTHGFMKIEG